MTLQEATREIERLQLLLLNHGIKDEVNSDRNIEAFKAIMDKIHAEPKRDNAD